VLSMTLGGYFLGQFEVVKKHIELIVVGIIIVSVMPAIFAWAKGRFGKGTPPADKPAVE
jgi:membrane-associated protein